MKNIIPIQLFTIFSIFFCASINAKIPHIATKSISVIVDNQFPGEIEFAKRIKKAGKNLGWNIAIYSDPFFKKTNLKKHDWNLILIPIKKKLPQSANILVLFDPVHHYFDSKGTLKHRFAHFLSYTTTYSDTTQLKNNLKNSQSSLYPKRFYPTVHYVPYVTVCPKELFYFIGRWGKRKEDARYQTLYEKLSQTNYTHFYGIAKKQQQPQNIFRGKIPSDGISVIKTITKHGICLVLHSQVHLDHHIPSGRIFEAAAASSVIISDSNPFIIKYFSDSVLYIDQTLSGEEMFKQIDSHIQWIQNNPQKALEKAKKAHEIFTSKFLLENQLKDLDNFLNSCLL